MDELSEDFDERARVLSSIPISIKMYRPSSAVASFIRERKEQLLIFFARLIQ